MMHIHVHVHVLYACYYFLNIIKTLHCLHVCGFFLIYGTLDYSLKTFFILKGEKLGNLSQR